uniref:Uncharacterized protein n=1 Tax=Arundo donax TaxID=35708 RepID=A0A0A9APM9_ARUDO
MVWSLQMPASHSRLAGAGSWFIFLPDVVMLALSVHGDGARKTKAGP